MLNQDDYLTTKEAADVARVSEKTIRRAIKRKELPAHKRGPRVWVIYRNDLISWAFGVITHH